VDASPLEKFFFNEKKHYAHTEQVMNQVTGEYVPVECFRHTMCDKFMKLVESQTFVDCHDLYKRVVLPLNELFGADTFMIVVGDTSGAYLRVECRVQYCFYCQWFRFKEWRGK
jgi:hypothetical protein